MGFLQSRGERGLYREGVSRWLQSRGERGLYTVESTGEWVAKAHR